MAKGDLENWLLEDLMYQNNLFAEGEDLVISLC